MKSASLCLSENGVAAFVEGRTSPEESAEIDRHLADCGACRIFVAGVAQTAGSANPRFSSRARDFALLPVDPGRYDVRHEVARGGMGRILAAWDRRHQREVAIKMLLTGDSGMEARFIRE